MKTTEGTTGSRGKKNELDKFYTNKDQAQWCINKLNITDYDLVIEPSAGSGSFSTLIDGCLSYDIAPEHPSIIEADWFTLDKTQFEDYENILVVGNPPFGRSGKLAIEFIKASDFANTIAFILPKGFKKNSTKNRMPLHWWCVREYDLPDNIFTLNGVEYRVPCVFQIWEKKNNPREKTPRITTSGFFEFTTKDDCDMRIQRVGGNAGKASLNLDASEQSNYFVKLTTDHLSVGEFMYIVNTTSFPTVDDTTGPRSLPKSELIEVLDQKLTNLTS